VLYGLSPPPTGKKGRPRVFKEPETWGTPAEVAELEDPYWGRVRLERWGGLHEKKGTDVPYDVIRACIHLERETPPSALWLAWLAPEPMPAEVTVETIWRAYSCRWPVEPAIQFRKESLGWTLPRFQSKEAGDRWSYRLLAALPGSPDCGRQTTSLAETAAAFDTPTGAAEPPADFCADWQPCSPSEKARKCSRMAPGQAKNTETTLWRGQKDSCWG